MAVLTGTPLPDTLFGLVNQRNEIFGLGGTDSLYGGVRSDSISGGFGDDYIESSDGDDILLPDAGSDIVYAGSGSDLISSVGSLSTDSDRIFGEFGNDTVEAGLGADRFFGGEGQDLVSYQAMSGGVEVDLVTGLGALGAAGDTFRSVEDVVGSLYGDTLIGNDTENELFGSDGNDFVRGGSGGDYLDGGEGTDRLAYVGSDSGVQIDLQNGECSGGDADGDQFLGFEWVDGSEYSDRLRGDSLANVLRGAQDADGLFGGDGNDTLSGGSGDDGLDGGFGTDLLIGGSGADRFVFSRAEVSPVSASLRDTIRDFSGSEGDQIRLDRMDANTDEAGDQAFVFLGTAGFSGEAGELRYAPIGSDVVVAGDVNGDEIADFAITVLDIAVMEASDFLL